MPLRNLRRLSITSSHVTEPHTNTNTTTTTTTNQETTGATTGNKNNDHNNHNNINYDSLSQIEIDAGDETNVYIEDENQSTIDFEEIIEGGENHHNPSFLTSTTVQLLRGWDHSHLDGGTGTGVGVGGHGQHCGSYEDVNEMVRNQLLSNNSHHHTNKKKKNQFFFSSSPFSKNKTTTTTTPVTTASTTITASSTNHTKRSPLIRINSQSIRRLLFPEQHHQQQHPPRTGGRYEQQEQQPMKQENHNKTNSSSSCLQQRICCCCCPFTGSCLWKFFFGTCYVTLVVFLLIMTYHTFVQEEIKQYETAFRNSASAVIRTSEIRLQMLRESMHSVSNQVAKYSTTSSSSSSSSSITNSSHVGRQLQQTTTNNNGPYLPTILDFDSYAEQIHTITEYPIVWYTPIVKRHYLQKYEDEYLASYYDKKNNIVSSSGGGISGTSTENVTYPGIWEYIPPNPLVVVDKNDTTKKIKPLPVHSVGPYHPIHQIYEGYVGRNAYPYVLLYDMMNLTGYATFYKDSIRLYKKGSISAFLPIHLFRDVAYGNEFTEDEPLSLFVEPIFVKNETDTNTTTNNNNNKIYAASLMTIIQWKTLFHDSVTPLQQTEQTEQQQQQQQQSRLAPPTGATFTTMVMACHIKNTCGDSYTFRVHDYQRTDTTTTTRHVEYVGTSIDDSSPSSTNRKELSNLFIRTSLEDPFTTYPAALTSDRNNKPGHCSYVLEIEPYSFDNNDDNNSSYIYRTNKPILYTIFVGCIFLILFFLFLVQNECSHRRTNQIVQKSSQMVVSLLKSSTANLHQHQLNSSNPKELKKAESTRRNVLMKFKSTPSGLRDYLLEQVNQTNHEALLLQNNNDETIPELQPLVDIFHETTILFADLVGFPSWSSLREPSQIFLFLETLYRTYDKIAKKRSIFKIETIRESYVAAAGIPTPMNEHAVVMCRFAFDIMTKTKEMTKKMEVILGPDTSDLFLRIGIHSGPVTAGVLRCEKERFQIFGETVSKAYRLERSGAQDRIQCSKTTADLLIAAGKQDWVIKREQYTDNKINGLSHTYWLEAPTSYLGSRFNNDYDPRSMSSDFLSEDGNNADSTDHFTALLDNMSVRSTKTKRLVDWNIDILHKLIRQIVAQRETVASSQQLQEVNSWIEESYSYPKSPLEEIQEVISFQQHSPEILGQQKHANEIVLDPCILEQLGDFVGNIALFYNINPFHNFEHASHVSMSITKLLAVTSVPCETSLLGKNGKAKNTDTLDQLCSIITDPLTQFACVFSALIHDADHAGVPNSQLVAEGHTIVDYYNGKNIAEQNAIDLCWDLLMKDSYSDLRNVICSGQEDLIRFRHLVVNAVLATDLFDNDLKEQRNGRWEKVFNTEKLFSGKELKIHTNHKATLIIEHMMQAADIAHTMQHWSIYRKWNEYYFVERYQAYRCGRAEQDPALVWYNNELDFFDSYVLPLARKLNECGLFGEMANQSYTNAMGNRLEWRDRGLEIVVEMLDRARSSADDCSYANTNTNSVSNSSNGRTTSGKRSSNMSTGSRGGHSRVGQRNTNVKPVRKPSIEEHLFEDNDESGYGENYNTYNTEIDLAEDASNYSASITASEITPQRRHSVTSSVDGGRGFSRSISSRRHSSGGSVSNRS